MALLFGLGLSLTLAVYGIAIAGAGKLLGLDRITQAMFFVAGLTAFLFGLSELKLLKFNLPTLAAATPQWIQEKGDYLKSFFLGLFLGNAGVGCPNPAFYVLLTYIASVGSLDSGFWLGLVHGIGRAFPLIALSVLGIAGTNATGWIVRKKVTIDKIIGWALVVIGAFILIQGLPGGHMWYEETFIHQGWNQIVERSPLPAEMEMEEHEHPAEPFQKFIPWIFLTLIIIPVIGSALKIKKRLKNQKKKYEVAITNNGKLRSLCQSQKKLLKKSNPISLIWKWKRLILPQIEAGNWFKNTELWLRLALLSMVSYFLPADLIKINLLRN